MSSLKSFYKKHEVDILWYGLLCYFVYAWVFSIYTLVMCLLHFNIVTAIIEIIAILSAGCMFAVAYKIYFKVSRDEDKEILEDNQEKTKGEQSSDESGKPGY